MLSVSNIVKVYGDKRAVDGVSFEIPAGEMVDLKPGGYHVMFFDLTQALAEGEMIEVTLEFEKGGKVTVPVMVGARDAKAMKHDH